MAEDKKVKKTKKSEKSDKSDTEAGSATPPAEAAKTNPEETPAAVSEAEKSAVTEEPAANSIPADLPPPPAPLQEPAPPELPSTKSANISESSDFQRLEEKAKKAEELLAAEVKVRKDLEGLNAKLLAEKTALLDSLSGEKGALQDYQERCAKLQAQKNDLDNQLRVSIFYNSKDHKIKNYKNC